MSKTIKLGSWVIAAVVRNTDKEFTLYLVGIVQPFANSYDDSARCDKEYQMLIEAMEGMDLYKKFEKGNEQNPGESHT